MDCSLPGFSAHGILQVRILEWVAMPSSRGIFPIQGLNPGLPHCRWIPYQSEPLGKPKNTGVGSLALLQGIFLTQELNQSLLHCGEGNGNSLHGVAKSWTRLSDFTFPFHFHALEKEMATHSSVLAWRILGTGSLVGCCLWGHTESDMTEVT